MDIRISICSDVTLSAQTYAQQSIWDFQIEIRKQSDLEKLAMTLWSLYPNKLLIADPRLKRRLEFRAKYDVKCATIADDISRAAIRATSEHNYKQILEICRNENQPG